MKQLSKRERIIALLRTFNDARETLQRGDAGGSLYPDDRLLLMPDAWTLGGYVELESALTRLKLREPSQYWHVTHRYLRTTRRTTEVTQVGGVARELPANQAVVTAVALPGEGFVRTNGKQPRVRCRAIVECWDEGVDVTVVASGVSTLTSLYKGWPRLPEEVYWNVSA